MGTGFALALRFCGTLVYGFIGGAGFGGGTGNGVCFGGEEPVVLGFELADGGVKSFFGSDFSFKVSHGK